MMSASSAKGTKCLVPVSFASAPISQLPRLVRDAELGLRAVAAGSAPLAEPGHALLALEPGELILSALKPAQSGDGAVVRVLNPGDEEQTARICLGFPVAGIQMIDLDESPCGESPPGSGLSYPTGLKERVVEFTVPPHALRTLLLRAAR
jgi:alpha-mannosidase